MLLQPARSLVQWCCCLFVKSCAKPVLIVITASKYTSNTYRCAELCSGWKKRQGRTQSSASPTEGITCPHGDLLPAALGPKAKRTAVPVPLWEYFQDRWHTAQQQAQQQQQEQAKTADIAEASRYVSRLPSDVVHMNSHEGV